ncbi:QacE family quaternary ammonium compound efflux SMR transporter [Aeromicrobium phragmitis]|uniref:QacE family quaternary ammonium compound efflux SMR transporter n=1 Tax=Aeromicrobium phragmitis TaxID=2478914 RepID=A0A3L8PK05_9ACTN|nr:SMR family transporter [Aeromicrobium phragmitis]RLV55687.1 QacE family quaternary ammonium compound efflux SMR transporter [Aeromicrobium phragmitis]
MSWVWLTLAIVAEIAATLSLRASDGLRRRRWVVVIVAGYGIAFTFLARALDEGMKVGVAYGVWTATGIAAVAVLARAFWDDPLTRRMLLGIAVIATGVLLVELG